MSTARDFLKSVSANRWLDGLSIVPVAGEHFIEYQTPYRTGIRHRVLKTLGFADRLGYGKWKLLSWAGRHDLPLPVESFTGEDLLKYVAKVRGPEIEELERHRRIIWRNEGKEGSARKWLAAANPFKLKWRKYKTPQGEWWTGSDLTTGRDLADTSVTYFPDAGVWMIDDYPEQEFKTDGEAKLKAEELWFSKWRKEMVGEATEGSAREWLRKSGQDRVPAFRIYGPHQTWIVARSGKVLKYSESEFVRQGLVDAERFNVAEYLSRETPVADWGGLPDIKLEKISFWGPGGTYRKSYSEIP